MKLSWRHHYIPQFYLRGFTNPSGLIYVFDKATGEIESSPKSTKSYFFERDRNTFMTPKGELDDFIESSFYKKFDNVSKYAFEKLRKEGAKSVQDNLRSLSSIIQFINGLFYRIPKYDEFHNNEIMAGTAKYLLPIYSGDHIDVSQEYHRDHKHEELYRYACRFFLSLKGIIPVGSELQKWQIIELPKTAPRGIFITGDCPIVINNEKLFNTGQEVILAPLTERHIAIRTNEDPPADISAAELIYFVNLYLLSRADRYVCCSSKEVLSFYVEKRDNYSADLLKGKVLSLIEPVPA